MFRIAAKGPVAWRLLSERRDHSHCQDSTAAGNTTKPTATDRRGEPGRELPMDDDDLSAQQPEGQQCQADDDPRGCPYGADLAMTWRLTRVIRDSEARARTAGWITVPIRAIRGGRAGSADWGHSGSELGRVQATGAW